MCYIKNATEAKYMYVYLAFSVIISFEVVQ